jgi:hypothetical protein
MILTYYMPSPVGSFIVLTQLTQPTAHEAAEQRWGDER